MVMEEIEMLKNRIAELEAVVGKEKDHAVREALREHIEKPPAEIIKMSEPEIAREVQRISGIKTEPETHDRQVLELLQLAQDKGILNAVSIVKELNDPHLEDDFHAALIKYFKNA